MFGLDTRSWRHVSIVTKHRCWLPCVCDWDGTIYEATPQQFRVFQSRSRQSTNPLGIGAWFNAQTVIQISLLRKLKTGIEICINPRVHKCGRAIESFNSIRTTWEARPNFKVYLEIGENQKKSNTTS